MNKKANKTVLETILDWSADRPLWQRDALRRIVTGGTPDDDGVKDILALCKKEHGAEGIALEPAALVRSEEHTSDLQSLMRLSYAVFCFNKNIYDHKPLAHQFARQQT